MRQIIRVFYLSISFFLVLLLGFSYWAYQHKDEVLKVVSNDLQKHFIPSINIQHYGFDPFRNFPYMSLSFTDVTIAHKTDTLARIEKMYFTFDLSDLTHQHYKIIQLYIEGGDLMLKTNHKGEHNFDVLKKTNSNTANQEGIRFELQHIIFQDINLRYDNQQKNQKVDMYIENIKSSFGFLDHDISTEIRGNLTVNHTTLDGNHYFDHKNMFVDLELMYWSHEKKWVLSNSKFVLENAHFMIQGEYFTETNYVDLRTAGKPNNLQTLLTFLPKEIGKKYSKYELHGKVHFNGNIQGYFTKKQFPRIDITFGMHDASCYHPDSDQTMDSLFMKGIFTNGNRQNSATSELSIKHFVGKIGNQLIRGKFKLSNLNYPILQMNLKCNFDLEHLLSFYTVSNIETIKGQTTLKLDFTGRIAEIKRNPNTSQVTAVGKLDFRNISFKLKSLKTPFKNFNGTLLFDNNNAKLKNVFFKIGQSKLELNGYFKNFMTWLFSEHYPLQCYANISSKKLYLNDLLYLQHNKIGSKNRQITIPKNIISHCKIHIDSAVFKHFSMQNIRSAMRLKKQAIKIDSMQAHVFGGSWKMRGTIDGSESKKIKVVTENQIQNTNIKKLFHAYNNFGQDFICDRHLSGNLDARWQTLLDLSASLEPDFHQLKTDIRFNLRNGKLIHFEPLKRIATLFNNKDIEQISFSEISDQIHIQNRRLTFSDLNIHSNIGVMKIAGTHDFDGNIDYRLQLPLRNFKKTKKDYAQYSVATSQEGETNIFLKIFGNTNHFKVRYDRGATWQKVRDSLYRKILKLQDLFKKKKQEEQQDLNDQFFN